MNSWGKQRSPFAAVSFHRSTSGRWSLRNASSSGIQVSVTRLSPCSRRFHSWSVVLVRHQVHEVFLQIGAGTRDDVDLPLTDHLGEGDADLGCAHRTGQRDEHLAPFREVTLVPYRRVHQGGGVEVPVMMEEELRYGASRRVHGVLLLLREDGRSAG
jgi:hypothetical protein